MDYYSTLGLNKSASTEEIRKAYKKLSMKHHPDRPGGSEAKFKEINEAYSVLSDPQKRAEYDNPQPQFNFNTSNPFGSNAGFEDIFADAFGFRRQPRRPAKNRDVRISYTVDFKDVFTGRGATISVKLPSGRQEVLDVMIPKGIKNGDTVNVSGYGDDSIKQLPRGDLFIRVRVRSDPEWQRDGDNIYTSKKINIFELILGTSTEIKTPEGRSINLNIPSGSRPGTTFSIPGYGTPNVNTHRPGNLYVKIDSIVPKIQDENLLNMLKELKDATT